MTELERPRSHRDERDEMIDRDSNAAALDAIITGAEMLALISWRRKDPAWRGALAVIFFALAGTLWAMRSGCITRLAGSLAASADGSCGTLQSERDECGRFRLFRRGRAFFLCGAWAILIGEGSGQI